ncbi:MAG: peptide chain release factor 2, partial [Candidatus Limnocylindria bacterium]
MDRLEADAAHPDLWVDRARAQALMKRLQSLSARRDRWEGYRRRAAELAELAPLAAEDPSLE